MINFDLKISKIVGATSPSSWSQTHVFLPEDKLKKAEFGSLLASISLKSLQEEIDISSFGKEVISRFHEIYYSSPEKTIFKKLKTSIKMLVTEFANKVEVKIATAIIVNSPEKGIIGYLAATANDKVFIFRQNMLVSLLVDDQDGIKIASGFLHQDDLLILGTDQFFQIISQGSLKAALENKNIEDIAETLAPIIHGHDQNSQAAAVIFRINILEDKVIKKPTRSITFPKPKFLPLTQLKNINIFANLKLFLNQFKKFKSEPSFYLKDEQKKSRAKKTTLTVALVLIFLLLISVILGVKKRSTSQESQTIEMLNKEVGYRYDQAISLQELNPIRARLLLTEAKQLIEENINKVDNKSERKKIEELKTKIDKQLESVAGEYKIESADVFLDLSLVKEGFKGSNWQATEDSIFIFDQDKKTVLSVDVNSKAVEVIAGGDRLAGGQLLAAVDNRVFILTAKKIIVIEVGKNEIIDEAEAKDWGEIVNMIGFSSNVYLLDKQAEQIWKYRGLNTGLSEISPFLKTKADELKDGLSMAIDGSIWVITINGNIFKYVRGVEDNFVLSGLDKPFDQDLIINTNENLDNLYILDRKNTRAVVINKDTGEYQSQYFWPGIAGVTDILAIESQEKILLLAGERIYQLTIKK